MQSLNQAHLICMELVHLIRWTTTEMKRKAMEEATGDYFPKVSAEESPYDVNDDAVLKRLYGLK